MSGNGSVPIVGSVVIDDLFKDWSTGEPATSFYQTFSDYGFNITSYDLTIGAERLSGFGGGLWMLVHREIGLNVLSVYTEWSLGPGWGSLFYFFDKKRNKISNENYYILPDLINFNNYQSGWNNILPYWSPSFNLWLTQENSYPVPEPTTLILFGGSLAGWLAYRMRKR